MKLQADLFLRALLSVKHALAPDLARPVLTAVSMEPAGEDAIYLTAADNYRIARVRVPAEDPLPGRWLIRGDALPILAAALKPLGKLSATILPADHANLRVSCLGTTVSVGLMEGDYPDVEKVMDLTAGVPPTVTVNAGFLRQLPRTGAAVDHAIVYVRDATSPVHLSIGPDYHEWLMPVRLVDYRPGAWIEPALREAIGPVVEFAARMAAPGSVLAGEVEALMAILDPESVAPTLTPEQESDS